MNKRISPRLLSPRLLFVVLTVFASVAIATRAQSTTGSQGTTTGTPTPDTSNVVTNWNPSVSYKAGQVVYCAACSVNGSKYVALLANVNVDPPSNLDNIWQLVTEVGAHSGTGATGATGATGSTGATGEPSPSSSAPPPSPALRTLL